jgi:hypothetical protein
MVMDESDMHLPWPCVRVPSDQLYFYNMRKNNSDLPKFINTSAPFIYSGI